jgi:ElaB/YqjD/DUF883 family membrane-anchored ribosome-binding protein
MANGPQQDEIEELRRQVQELSEKLGAAAQGSIEDMKDNFRQNVSDIEKQIRANPVQAAVIAAGVGFLIGALITR